MERNAKLLKYLDRYLGIPLIALIGVFKKRRHKPKEIRSIGIFAFAAGLAGAFAAGFAAAFFATGLAALAGALAGLAGAFAFAAGFAGALAFATGLADLAAGFFLVLGIY